MKIKGIILAAGSSSRMGKNKLSLDFHGIKVINRVIENAKESKIDELIVVHGRYDLETDINKIYNPDFENGMSTSIKAGLRNYNGDAVMLLLGDMPLVTSSIIDKLYEGFKGSEKNIAAPIYNGKRGNPVIIGNKYFDALLNNTGDKGARNIIRENPQDIELVEIKSEAIFMDIDCEKDYKQIY